MLLLTELDPLLLALLFALLLQLALALFLCGHRETFGSIFLLFCKLTQMELVLH
jgi:hypothetical protein